MEKSTRNILIIGGVSILIIGYFILNKEEKGTGDVSSESKKGNKLILTR